ncbi:MAG: hypothetical protein Q8R69_10580 [Telluria sp.]|nr:hypothetical protein [Telluria sp.]
MSSKKFFSYLWKDAKKRRKKRKFVKKCTLCIEFVRHAEGDVVVTARQASAWQGRIGQTRRACANRA